MALRRATWEARHDARRLKPLPALEGEQARGRRSARPCRAVGLGRDRQDPCADRARAAAAARRRAARDDPVPDLHQGRRGGDGQSHRRAAGGLGAAAGRATCARSCSRSASATTRRCSQRARQLFARVLEAPGRPAHPDHPRLRPDPARGLSRRRRASRPGFRPLEGRAEQELARRTLADLLADAEARRR